MPKKGDKDAESKTAGAGRRREQERDSGGSPSWVEESAVAYERDPGWIEEPNPLSEPPTDPMRTLESTQSGTRVLQILSTIFPTRDALLDWLNRPHADLGGRTPLQMAEMGYPGAVEGMLEAALLGLPS